MTKIQMLFALFATSPAIMGVASAQTEKRHIRASTIRLEDQRKVAVELARLRRRFPLGTMPDAARAALVDLGARCQKVPRLVCTYRAYDADDDVLREVIWTVSFEDIPSGLPSRRLNRAVAGPART